MPARQICDQTGPRGDLKIHEQIVLAIRLSCPDAWPVRTINGQQSEKEHQRLILPQAHMRHARFPRNPEKEATQHRREESPFPPLRRALCQRKYDGLWAPTTFRDSSIVLDEHAGMYQVEWSTGEDPTGHVGGLYWFTYEDLRHSSMVRSRRTRL